MKAVVPGGFHEAVYFNILKNIKALRARDQHTLLQLIKPNVTGHPNMLAMAVRRVL